MDRPPRYMCVMRKRALWSEDFAQVPLTHEPVGMDEVKERQGVDTDALKKAQVWEIWDKTSQTVRWVAEGYDAPLDEKEDPYGLDSFWPCRVLSTLRRRQKALSRP